MAEILSQKYTGKLSPEISQGQKLKLSAHQLHSVQILESSTEELESTLRELVNSNPLLALVPPGESAIPEDGNFFPEDPAEQRDGEIAFDDDNFLPQENDTVSYSDPTLPEMDNREKEWEDHLEELAENAEDTDWQNALSGDERMDNISRNTEEDAKDHFFNSLTRDRNLKDLLMEELAFADVNGNVKRAAECIIGALEENGYFTDALTDVAQTADTTLPEAEEALALVRSFEPPGVAASSLSECLLLQMKYRKIKDPLLEKIIKNHLEDVAKNRLPFLAEKLKTTLEKLSASLEKLKKLDPAPGGRYNETKHNVIIPDVIVEEQEDGEFSVTLNDRNMPRLYFTHTYDSLMDSPSLPPEDKNYFREKKAEGNLAIYELEHRASTILRIARLIVSEQYEFMKQGGSSLKPLTMHQAADKLGVDDSTVSRGCNQKYMLTPRGVFEFKYFFNTGFVNKNGEEASNKAVMEMIKEMIDGEDPSKPLSDDTLSKMLKEKGFSVARRTVMKYRENMKIPSSQGRRKHI